MKLITHSETEVLSPALVADGNNLRDLIRLITSDEEPGVLLKTFQESLFYRNEVEAIGYSAGDELISARRARLTASEHDGVGRHIKALESGVIALYVLDGKLVVSKVEEHFASSPPSISNGGAQPPRFTSQLLGVGECFIFTAGMEFVLSAKGREPVLVLELELSAKHHSWDIDPAALAALSIQINGLADYYYGYDERYAKVYEEGAALWEAAEANELLPYLLMRYPRLGLKVIDLGCGEGRDSIYLASLGYDVVGVDVSRAALDRARTRSAGRGITPRFLERDVITLRNIPNGSFNWAINMGCLHMLTDPAHRAGHLASVFRALLPGGTFVITHCRRNWGKGFFSIPHHDQLGKLVPGTVIDRRIRVNGGCKFVPLEVLPYKEASETELIAEVSAAGFDIVELLSQGTDAFGDSVVLIARKPQSLI